MACEEEFRSVQDLEKEAFQCFVRIRRGRSTKCYRVVRYFCEKSWHHQGAVVSLSALASTSALIGKTALEVFPFYEKKGNLVFMPWRNQGPENHPRDFTGVLIPL